MEEMGHNGLIKIAEGGDFVGFFDKLFGNDASFLGFMDFTGELEDEQEPDEVEVTFTIEVEDEEGKGPVPPRKSK
ncbi:MAG: hypothetical protein RR816_07245 [Clostridia bacterium]